MSQTMTLELTDEIYEAVKKAAATDGLQPGEWVVNSLHQHLPVPPPGSPQAILQALQQAPRLATEDVDALEQAIKEGALPPDLTPIFPDCEHEAA